MKDFPVLRFAVAAGIFLSLHAVIVTICALAGVPGMRPFAELLTQFYGPYGYSIRRSASSPAPSWAFSKASFTSEFSD